LSSSSSSLETSLIITSTNIEGLTPTPISVSDEYGTESLSCEHQKSSSSDSPSEDSCSENSNNLNKDEVIEIFNTSRRHAKKSL